MYNNHDYPVGADNSTAPWNATDNKEIERICEVTETITRKVKISTIDYVETDDWNDDAGACSFIDTSETNWREEFQNQGYSILELISFLKDYVEEDLKNTSLGTSKGRDLQKILSSCSEVELLELDVIEE